MLALYKKELQSYFYSPFAYIISALFMLVFSLSFISGISNMDANTFKFSFSNVFYNNFFYFIFMIPLLTMRTFADERKNSTETLLLSAPISMPSILLAKYLAVVTVFLSMMVLSLVFPLIAVLNGTVVISSLICGYIGFFLWGMVCIAVGVMMSALTDNPILAAVFGEAAMILVVFLDNFTSSDLIQSIPPVAVVFEWFSTEERFVGFSQGLFSVSDLVFFLTLSTVILAWTDIILEKRRWSRG